MKIKINNISLNYEKVGKGRPLILLHGNGEDHHIFDKLIEKLKLSFSIYAIDSRNHGKSSYTSVYSYETMAEDIYQFIKKMKLEKVSVVGFSDGAILALLVSIHYPDIFHKMVLLGANLCPSDFKEDIYQQMEKEYKQTRNPLIKMMLEQPDINPELLKGINIPTLVIGAKDDIYKEGTFENIARAMPCARLKIMEGYDHGNYVINNDILFSDLYEFLQ